MGLTQIDINLMEAWQRIGAKCRSDRMEALRRARRRLRPTFSSPPRAWCLCIRAADRRIGLHNGVFDFPLWHEQEEDDPRPEEAFIAEGETWASALDRGVRHQITLTGTVIRELTKPVTICWPGKPLSEVAEILGRHKRSLMYWIDRSDAYPYSMPVAKKSLASGRSPALKRKDAPPLVRGVLKLWGYHYAAIHGKRGMPIPIVYTPSPIDPNHDAGRPPNGVWGSIWQWLYKRLPESYEQRFEREMDWKTYRGKPVQRGWRWICPGRAGADGTFLGCGRRCRNLYAPMPIMTLGLASGARLALDMPDGCGLAGQWHPGEHDPAVGEGNRSFACKVCWKMRNTSLASDIGWNEFVSYLSGGLLYGKEVPRPMEEAPAVRRQRFARHPRKSPKNERVLNELLAGFTIKEIAARLDMNYMAAWRHVFRARREHGVNTNEELISKLRAERNVSPPLTQKKCG